MLNGLIGGSTLTDLGEKKQNIKNKDNLISRGGNIITQFLSY